MIEIVSQTLIGLDNVADLLGILQLLHKDVDFLGPSNE